MDEVPYPFKGWRMATEENFYCFQWTGTSFVIQEKYQKNSGQMMYLYIHHKWVSYPTSIVKSIMQYQLPNPALKWGRDNEDNGIKEYMSQNEQKHSNLKYCSSGLTVSTDYSNPFAPEHSNPYAPTLALCSARWCALKDRSDSGLFFENTNIVGT